MSPLVTQCGGASVPASRLVALANPNCCPLESQSPPSPTEYSPFPPRAPVKNQEGPITPSLKPESSFDKREFPDFPAGNRLVWRIPRGGSRVRSPHRLSSCSLYSNTRRPSLNTFACFSSCSCRLARILWSSSNPSPSHS